MVRLPTARPPACGTGVAAPSLPGAVNMIRGNSDRIVNMIGGDSNGIVNIIREDIDGIVNMIKPLN